MLKIYNALIRNIHPREEKHVHYEKFRVFGNSNDFPKHVKGKRATENKIYLYIFIICGKINKLYFLVRY